MRQSCTILNKNRVLVLFILATIIFTYGYEGIISSFVTVPSPVKVYQSLGELLENGYRIVGHHVRASDHQLKNILRKQNISLEPQSSVYNDEPGMDDDNITTAIIQCNATKEIWRPQVSSLKWQHEVIAERRTAVPGRKD